MDHNQVVILIAAVVIVLIVIVAVAFVTSRKRRSQKLRQRFGPEYERVLQQEGNARKAEGVLEFRQREERSSQSGNSRRRTSQATLSAGMRCRHASSTTREER